MTGAVIIDLDVKAAARREAQGEPPSVIFAGVEFELPVELTFDLVDALADVGDGELGQVAVIREMAKALFRDRYAEFVALRPSMADIQELINGVSPVYGLSLGESAASE